MLWYKFFNLFVKITGAIPQWLIFRIKIHYEDKKTQNRTIKGKAILFANHRSVFDVAIMLFVFWRRMLRCLVAELMYKKNIFMSIFLKSMGFIRVDRNSHDFTFIEKSCRILDKGGVIEIYPESRLPTENEEAPLPFKPSVAYIALQSGAPLIPVYTRGQFFSAKERIEVMIGTPIQARDLYDNNLTEAENLDQITKFLRQRIIELGQELEKQTQHEREKK